MIYVEKRLGSCLRKVKFLSSRECTWTGSEPPRGSGWVRRRHRRSLRGTHPLPRGGSDRIQVTVLSLRSSSVQP
jgi:hypothetical protein